MNTNKPTGSVDTKELEYYGLNPLTHNPNTTRIDIRAIVFKTADGSIKSFVDGNMDDFMGEDARIERLIFNTTYSFEGNELPTHWIEIWYKNGKMTMYPISKDQIIRIHMNVPTTNVYCMAQSALATMDSLEDLMDEDEDDKTFEDFASVVDKNFK